MEYGSLGFNVVAAVIKIAFMIMGFLMPLASILTWLERRQSSMMQDRLGPNRANIGPIKAWGITHFLADALKFMGKEDYVPGKAHKFLFMWAPIMAMAPALIVAAIIPFGPPLCWGELLTTNPVCQHPIDLQIARLDIGLLFYFAISSLSVYGATLAGWASHNKWAMMGGLRATSQMMSYEVTMGMAVLGSFLVYGTLEPGAIADLQTHFISFGHYASSWGIFTQPVGFILFLTAAIAETKRTPFDIPEGEPEIIGYFVEYSGIRWGMFFLAEFIEIVFISSVIATVFFGGWQLPFLDADGFRIGGYFDPVSHAQVGGWYLALNHWKVVLLQFLAFGGKVVLLSVFQLLVRWTLPRFRADQLMNLGWKILLPLSLVNIMLVALIKLIAMAVTGS